MLRCEQNTRRVEREIRRAAKAVRLCKTPMPEYEHGQWWVIDLETGAAWSVHDCVPLQGRAAHVGHAAVNNFCFEQVVEGDCG